MSRRGPLPVVSLAENLTISPCSIDLSRGETQFIAEAGREYLLQTCLEKTDLRQSTTVILDCPPSLGVLSLACFTAADYACVVVQPGGFEVRTLIHLQETVRLLNERLNPRLSVIGAVLTNCHLRRAITEEVCREVPRHRPVLGQVRADARLLYATTSDKVLLRPSEAGRSERIGPPGTCRIGRGGRGSAVRRAPREFDLPAGHLSRRLPAALRKA
jgi:chromosome partitioning protein